MKARIIFLADMDQVCPQAPEILRVINAQMRHAGLVESIAAEVRMFSTIEVHPNMIASMHRVAVQIERNVRLVNPDWDFRCQIERVR